jgi:hypothetical protein
VIIKDDALSKEGGLYYYKGKLFDGVVLTILDEVITKKLEYQFGQPVGEYISPYFPFNKEDLHIETHSFTPAREESYKYKGKHFCGITYYFKDSQCVLEQQYDEYGWLVSEARYDSLGKLKSFSVSEDDFTQEYDLFDDRTIKKFEVNDRNNCSIVLVFVPGGAIRSLRVGDNYFNRVKDLGDRVKFHLFDDIDFIAKLRGAEISNVSGSGITKEVFDFLLDNNGLKNTTELYIRRTPLEINSLKKLIPLNNITKLEIDSKVLTLDDLKGFKSQRQDCTVTFNREEVI